MIKIFKSEETLSKQICSEMIEQLINLEHPVFCMASGNTPSKCYKNFTEEAVNLKEIKKLKFVSLDEWVNIPKDSEGSCFRMLYEDLFGKLPLEDDQVIFFDTVGRDPQDECRRIDRFISQNPITYSIMGVGMNGHIGLNEPGSPIRNYSSIVKLSETTVNIGQKYFNKQTELNEGITIGLGQIIGSKRVVVIITGKHKQKIVKEIIENPGAKLPAQELMGISHIDFYIDRDAAGSLDPDTLNLYI